MPSMLKSVVLLLVTAATVSSSVLAPRACAADLCLRSVRATQRGTTGSADCASYWRTTYTPPTVTVYATETAQSTVTVEVSVTQTDTVHLTTVTEVPTTLVVNVPTTFTRTLTMGVNFFKRQEPGNVIPAYASNCSGAARYSSACSCIGVSTVATVTALAPTTVITVSETSTSTKSQTIVLDTVEVSATDVTVTSPLILSSTTVYSGPTVTVTQFALQVASGHSLYVGKWLKKKPYGTDTQTLELTANASEAEVITLYPNGRISMSINAWPGILYAGAVYNNVNNVNFQWEQNFLFGTPPLICSLGFDRILSCTTPGNYHTFGINYGALVWAIDQAQLTSTIGALAVTLRAVAHV